MKCGIKVERILGDVTRNKTLCAKMAIHLRLGLLRKQMGRLNLGLGV